MIEEALKKRLERETKARLEAEKLLEEKAHELFLKNQELENMFLQQKIERLQLFENSVVGICLSYDGVLLEINNTFADLLGYEKEELVGKQIIDITHPDDRTVSQDRTRELQDNEINRFNVSKRYQRKDGTYFWGLTNVNKVLDVNGNTKYLLAVIHNINNEVITQNKLELTVEHLKEINENLQQFAYIVSHDLKAPLNGMNTIIQWLKEKNDDEESLKYLKMLEERSAKMNDMIKEILNYSKQKAEDETKDLISSEAMIIDVINTFEIPKNVKITTEGKFPKLYANPTKIKQIFSNLIDNSIKNMNKPNGLIKISAKEFEDSYQFLVFDNGNGIARDKFDKIFELYHNSEQDFTTNNGIGLALVKRIVDQYGGKIAVQSEIDLFTEISFTLSKQLTLSKSMN